MSFLLRLGSTIYQTVVMLVHVVHVGSGPCSLSLFVYRNTAALEQKEMMLVVSLSRVHTWAMLFCTVGREIRKLKVQFLEVLNIAFQFQVCVIKITNCLGPGGAIVECFQHGVTTCCNGVIQEVFGPRVLLWYGGPREFVLLVGSSLTSWTFLCNSRLCFRVPIRIRVPGQEVLGQSGTCSFQVSMDGMGMLEQPTFRILTGYLST